MKEKKEATNHSKYLERLVIIDKMLENRANPKTYDQMLDKLQQEDLSITERQLRSTFKLLEDQFDLEIEKKTNDNQSNKKTVFYYKRKEASLFAKNFKSNELEQILKLVSQLRDYEGLNNEQIQDILKNFDIEIDKENNNRVVEYEKNDTYQDNDYFSHFNTLYDAIKDKEVLLIEYKTYSGIGGVFVFHPYYLKQYNSRWFCLGHKENTPDERRIDIIPIDNRIESIQSYQLKYPKDKAKKFISDHNVNDWKLKFFNNFIGITKGKRISNDEQRFVEVYPNVEKVKLLITQGDAKTLKYLESKPIHHSQKTINQTNGDSILELTLIPNYELERLILSYSDVLTVLEPPILRDEINKRLQKSINNYK